MGKIRKAGDVFTGHHEHSPYDHLPDGSFVLNKKGLDVMETLNDASGKYTTIIPHTTPGKDSLYGTGGGYMEWAKPTEINVDPHASAHVLAHEGAHSQFPTALDDSYVKKMIEGNNNPYAGNDWDPYENTVPRTGAGVRYMYETEAVPTMLEEANAQGVARAVTDKMGLGNLEGRDNLTYPLSYGHNFLNKLDNTTPMLDGKPLGIGISGNESEREEYYKIAENMRLRAQRQFDKGYDLIPQ